MTLAPHGLTVLGGFHANAEDAVPGGCKALILLGPGPDFWNVFSASDEYQDGEPDPLDRWSARVVGAHAQALGAQALFPFGGPPYHPFYTWALRSARTWASPVALLVHDEQGLFVSFRAALALPNAVPVPEPAARPCDTCAQPCTTACPVGALGPEGYDVAACHNYLDTPDGADCMARGCAARRACPVGTTLRTAEQSAFHMAAFHRR